MNPFKPKYKLSAQENARQRRICFRVMLPSLAAAVGFLVLTLMGLV